MFTPIAAGTVLAALFLRTSDPFFAVIFVVVAIGVVLTGSAYLTERTADRS